MTTESERLENGVAGLSLLFLSNLYPPYDLGGFEQWCHEVAVGLRQRGHTVRILTSRYGMGRQAPPEPDVVRTLRLQADVHHYRPWRFFLDRGRHERSNERELRQALGRFAPDLVVVWGMWNLSRNVPYWAEQWLPGQVAYYLASYWPTDADIHTEYWQRPANHRVTEWIRKPVGDWVLKRLSREGYPPPLCFDRAVCCSQYVRDQLVQAGQLPASAGVLFGGIDPAPFLGQSPARDGDGTGPLRLIYLGSLLPHKGVHTAIEALDLLDRHGLRGRANLTILGRGHPDYEAQLHTLVERLGLGDRVSFAGRVPRSEIPTWLARFDACLFTSIWPEPMARSVMEAMAAGLLVIGSRAGGQVEMLHDEENGLTFQARDAAGLAGCIARAIEQPEMRRRLAAAGRQTVLERFTIERMVGDIEQWLQSIQAARHAWPTAPARM